MTKISLEKSGGKLVKLLSLKSHILSLVCYTSNNILPPPLNKVQIGAVLKTIYSKQIELLKSYRLIINYLFRQMIKSMTI
ncbi:MAG: hypothetical protein DRG78_20290 [Epsilonproteobacteria bacterium]|nr:MAG: hypothetical protein DRG78_20290 [Campylobacterota bacterium]